MKMTAKVEALLHSGYSVMSGNTGITTVTFEWPSMSFDDRPFEERVAEYHAGRNTTPAFVEYESIRKMPHTGKAFSLANLESSTIEERLVIVDVHCDYVDGLERHTYGIDTRWVILDATGERLEAYRAPSMFITAKFAEAARKKWLKQAQQLAADEAFFREHGVRLADLACYTPAAPEPSADTEVGSVVSVHGHGKRRVGIVVEVSKTRVRVAWMTPASVKDGGWPVFNWHAKV